MTKNVAQGDVGAEELDAIEARANAATPGPWASETRTVDHGNGVDDWHFLVMSDGESVHTIGIDDAAFIAAARADVPALVAEVRRLRALLAPVQEAAQAWRGEHPGEAPADRGYGYVTAPVLRAALATIADEKGGAS